MTPIPKLAVLSAAILLPAACAGSGVTPGGDSAEAASMACDGTTLFEGVESAWEEAQAAPTSQALEDKARARAIYYWGYAGMVNLSGWSKAGLRALSTCYADGECGLPASQQATDALTTSAEGIYNRDWKPVPAAIVPELPPQAAWDWAGARTDWESQDCTFNWGGDAGTVAAE